MIFTSQIQYIKNFVSSPKVLRFILITVCIESLLEAGLRLFGSIGVSDESWYYYLIQTQALMPMTYFHSYFSIFRGCGVFAMRLLVIGMYIIGGLFFSYGLYRYFKKDFSLTANDRNIILLLGTSAVFLFCGTSNQIPSYISFNCFIGALSFGLFLLSSPEDSVKNCTLVFLSGLILSQILFVMPPNAVLFPVFSLFMFLNRKKWQNIFWIIGITGGILVFFIFIASPLDIFNNNIHPFLELNHQAVSNSKSVVSSHNGRMLFVWIYHTALYLLQYLPLTLLFAVVLEFQKSENSKRLIFQKMFYLLIIIMLVLDILQNLKQGTVVHGKIRLYWPYCLLAGVGLSAYLENVLKGEKLYFLLILLFLPLAFSFGTDVTFAIRGCAYVIFLIPTLWIFFHAMHHRSLHFFFSFLLISCMMMGWASFVMRPWDTGMRFVDIRKQLQTPAKYLFTTPKHYNTIEILRKKSIEKKYLVDLSGGWQYNILLNKLPLHQDFRYWDGDITHLLAEQKITKENIAFLIDDLDTPSKNTSMDQIQKYYKKSPNIEKIEEKLFLITFDD